MRFLPDSAILGTYKRIKHMGKPRRRKGVSRPKPKQEQVLGRSWSSYQQDARTFEQLLAEAERHAQEKQKAGK